MAKRERRTRQRVYLISDSSANLLEHHFSAVLTQFPEKTFVVHTVPFVDTEVKLDRAIKRIRGGCVCHAVVDPKLKKKIAAECKRLKLPSLDVTGPTVKFLESAAGVPVSADPTRLHTVDSGYMGRMAAIEFAMQHDDNRRIDRLDHADVILVGISRVSKSPTALFLAYRGLRVANVAIVPSEGLPQELRRHRRKNVAAFTMQPRKLAEIRRRRFADWSLDEMAYADVRDVMREVRDAETLYGKKKWPIIDTTNLAVEETSALVLEKLKLRPKLVLA